MLYRCPNGHEIEAAEFTDICCRECKLVATHYNFRTGDVYEWTPLAVHRAAVQRMNAMMEEASDPFRDTGW